MYLPKVCPKFEWKGFVFNIWRIEKNNYNGETK